MAEINRIADLTSGLTMVVTDLHGDHDAFARYMGRFLQLRTRGKVNRILFLGDLIHRDTGPDEDASLQLVQDLMRTQKALPAGTVVMLLGNHEMPHLYGVTLARGDKEYTPRFEKALTDSGKRDEILEFFASLPFYARSAAGVMFAHAGPHNEALTSVETLRRFDHQAILDEYDQVLKTNPRIEQLRSLYGKTMGMPYEVLARYYLSVSGKDDPRFNHLLRAWMIGQESKEFALLWDILFTQCELGTFLPVYERLLKAFLLAYSADAPAPQKFLVTGHIRTMGGHAVVTENHLRISSAAHASPREAGQYLLLDLAKPITSMRELEGTLNSVY